MTDSLRPTLNSKTDFVYSIDPNTNTVTSGGYLMNDLAIQYGFPFKGGADTNDHNKLAIPASLALMGGKIQPLLNVYNKNEDESDNEDSDQNTGDLYERLLNLSLLKPLKKSSTNTKKQKPKTHHKNTKKNHK